MTDNVDGQSMSENGNLIEVRDLKTHFVTEEGTARAVKLQADFLSDQTTSDFSHSRTGSPMGRDCHEAHKISFTDDVEPT